MPPHNQCSIEHSVAWTASSGQVYTLHLTLNYRLEHGYGADADGNRGQSVWFADDHTIDENPFTPEVMGRDYIEWQEDGFSLESMIEQAWDEAELD